MEVILTNMTISISEFKANPNQAVKNANGMPFCVLTNNAPAFYVVPPKLWEKIDDMVQDQAMLKIAEKRSAEYHAKKKRKSA